MGIHTGLTLCCPPGEQVLVDRGCHRAVYNALAMLEQIHFPQELIATSTAATFERAIRDARIPAAV